MPKQTTQSLGLAAEEQALRYLERKGLQLITKNFHCRLGEIDLIMRDGEDIVFIEVRSRGRMDYGTASDSINKRKQGKLIKSATLFLQKCGLLYKVSSRFDVIAIHQTCHEMQLEWIINAFTGT